MPARLRFSLVAVLAFTCSVAIADNTSWRGVAVTDYIAHLMQQGLPVIYSSDLVQDNFTVREEPSSADPATALREVLEPYGLALNAGPSGRLLIVDASVQLPAEQSIPGEAKSPIAEPSLPEIVVSSSLYVMRYEQAGSHTFLDRDLTTKLPDVGDEAIRGIDRLPGIANGGLSTRSNVRGGVNNEQLLLFDGLRLYEPYHLKDFHSVSTIIDQNAIDGIDFYSAGYQARYGDRMSGVIDISRRDPPSGIETELGLSLFNTSVLSLGRFGGDGRGDWMVSARRSNLDLIVEAVDPDYGKPRYQDLFGHIGWEWSDRTSIAANVLFSYDKLTLSQTDDSEQATATYSNRVVWLKAETDWTDTVSSSTIISETDIHNARKGQTVNPGIMVGSVEDKRDFRMYGLQQDWVFSVSDTLLFSTGFNFRELQGDYRYDSELTIEAPFDQILDNAPYLARDIDTAPEGDQFAAYVESRWKASDDLVLDFGLRWDRQTYTTRQSDDQTSPRFNLLYHLGEKTELRFGYGEFYQAQEINELQIADGEVDFGIPQHARHVVASWNQRFGETINMRVEFYQKKYEALHSRYENVFDPLVLIPELQIDRVRIDAMTATARGAELMLSGEHDSGRLRWWLSHTWSFIEDELPQRDVRRSWDQRHTGKAGINWDWKRWSFSAAGTVHTGWPKTGLIAETVLNGDGSTSLVLNTTPRNSNRYSLFHTLDLRASRQFKVRYGDLLAFIEVANVYDRRNICCSQYSLDTDGNGDTVVDSKDGAWLPLVPSIGVIWRF